MSKRKAFLFEVGQSIIVNVLLNPLAKPQFRRFGERRFTVLSQPDRDSLEYLVLEDGYPPTQAELIDESRLRALAPPITRENSP